MITDNLPEPNIPLLRKAVEWAEAEAAKTDGTGQWDQHFWAYRRTDCQTSYCIAGFVAMAAQPGATAVESDSGDLDLVIDGEVESWADTAQSLLAITRAERLDLFDGINTIADVRRAAEDIAARAGERL